MVFAAPLLLIMVLTIIVGFFQYVVESAAPIFLSGAFFISGLVVSYIFNRVHVAKVEKAVGGWEAGPWADFQVEGIVIFLQAAVLGIAVTVAILVGVRLRLDSLAIIAFGGVAGASSTGVSNYMMRFHPPQEGQLGFGSSYPLTLTLVASPAVVTVLLLVLNYLPCR